MNEIDLRRFDLNLLVVLEVLMAERSVTRAAERLGRTQSAVSHSLSRLREQLGDPLLLKGAGRMQPTAFALEFMEQARPILQSMRRVLSPRRAFDPATSRRLFRFAAPDFARTLFTALLARVRAEAPGVAVEWTSSRDPMLLEIAEGQIDVAIAPAELRLPEGVTGERIGALKWGCFARRGHPAFRKWGPREWSRWPHVAVRVGDSLASPVNTAAAAAGLERTITGWVPHFSAIPICWPLCHRLPCSTRSANTASQPGTCRSPSTRSRTPCCGVLVAATIPRSLGCVIGFDPL